MKKIWSKKTPGFLRTKRLKLSQKQSSDLKIGKRSKQKTCGLDWACSLITGKKSGRGRRLNYGKIFSLSIKRWTKKSIAKKVLIENLFHKFQIQQYRKNWQRKEENGDKINFNGRVLTKHPKATSGQIDPLLDFLFTFSVVIFDRSDDRRLIECRPKMKWRHA